MLTLKLLVESFVMVKYQSLNIMIVTVCIFLLHRIKLIIMATFFYCKIDQITLESAHIMIAIKIDKASET